jgi:hypothetical protein
MLDGIIIAYLALFTTVTSSGTTGAVQTHSVDPDFFVPCVGSCGNASDLMVVVSNYSFNTCEHSYPISLVYTLTVIPRFPNEWQPSVRLATARE